ncbi:hypothetical protein ES705_34921 [subsurface metagenome]
MEAAEKLRFLLVNRVRIEVVYSISDWKSEKSGGTLGFLILTITIIKYTTSQVLLYEN